KAALKVKAGDNAGGELPELTTFGLGYVGAILILFYNVIGLVIFDQQFWYELNGKIFILVLMGGILVYVVALIFVIFFYSRNLAKEKGISLLGGFVAFIELMYNDYKKLKKKQNPSLGEENTDDTNDIDV
ncbi:MAG: hypothetical protein IKN43_00610, partial [Selenomonadaceae bacterium]|nr:hypothetical protein [Selenomonadaceae bacterium]